MLDRGPQLIVALLALLLAAASPALADKGREHEGERTGHERHEEQANRAALSRAVETGEALALADVLKIVRAKEPGEIVGVEVESGDGGWYYEVRVAGTNGRLVEVYVDARSGAILKTEAK